ncbi:YggT family protein [uncultured Clostridium sp.]|uniref:YggT family protein n=1 Tax=uncultured Clostridium sp. TaxID=59620 RepID=UPI002616B7AA|nr:YggT family protein [uncultured Clostridium sp.]
MSRLIFTFIDALFNVLEILILADVILSYFRNLDLGGVREFISALVGPILMPFRMLLNKIFGYSQFDFSPLIAIIALEIIKNLLIRLL